MKHELTRAIAEAILTSTDPAVHAAFLAALVRAGIGDVEWRVAGMDAPKYDRTSSDYPEREYTERLRERRGGRIQRRYVTRWEDVE